MMDYYAHKREDGELQTVKQHLEGVAELAGMFASKFGAMEQGIIAGMAHDIGKYSVEFQRRLLDDGPKVDHATAGALECIKNRQAFAALCIAGHHGGLPNLGSKDDLIEGTFYAKINRAIRRMIPSYEAWKTEVKLPEAQLPNSTSPNALDDIFFIRMLYSCLVDADYLDTEHFMKNKEREHSEDTLGDLLRKLLIHIEKAGWTKPKGALNQKRREILENCLEKANNNRGFFTLSVPTGGGKTISSLAFALQHAVKNGMDRIIYIIPYTSIIEQTAEVFRNILGKENVLEHHSGVEYDTEERVSALEIKLSLASENWDMPVIVTTAVQFFESLFANKSSKCRKLHNLANSIMIFDEAQMLPLPYIKPCIYAMSQLVLHYNASIVLCTATQPALSSIFKCFTDSYRPIELCPKEIITDPIFRRTKVQMAGSMSWKDISEYMNSCDQVLCIVNSRAGAEKIFEYLEGDGCFHLSTLMIPSDRVETLRMIREKLKRGEKCRVVSTSLIEAGVDVDFPQVLREEAGLDSVIQAAGRCNREGKKNACESVVRVFHPVSKPPALFQTNIDVGIMTMRECEDVFTPSAIELYFSNLFTAKGEKALDINNVIEQSKNATFPFKTIAEHFHLIETVTKIVYIPVGEGEELVRRKINGECGKTLLREMNQFAVNIYEDHLKALVEAGDVQPFEDGTWYLSNLDLYNSKTGLSLKADFGKAEFV